MDHAFGMRGSQPSGDLAGVVQRLPPGHGQRLAQSGALQ